LGYSPSYLFGLWRFTISFVYSYDLAFLVGDPPSISRAIITAVFNVF